MTSQQQSPVMGYVQCPQIINYVDELPVVNEVQLTPVIVVQQPTTTISNMEMENYISYQPQMMSIQSQQTNSVSEETRRSGTNEHQKEIRTKSDNTINCKYYFLILLLKNYGFNVTLTKPPKRATEEKIQMYSVKKIEYNNIVYFDYQTELDKMKETYPNFSTQKMKVTMDVYTCNSMINILETYCNVTASCTVKRRSNTLDRKNIISITAPLATGNVMYNEGEIVCNGQILYNGIKNVNTKEIVI